MNWTTEYPTEPGFYWVKSRVIEHGELPTPIIVYLNSLLDFYECSIGVTFSKPDILSAEWFGPITPPENNKPTALTQLFHNRLTNRGKQTLTNQAIEDLEAQENEK